MGLLGTARSGLKRIIAFGSSDVSGSQRDIPKIAFGHSEIILSRDLLVMIYRLPSGISKSLVR
jgi:hypothetical protein